MVRCSHLKREYIIMPAKCESCNSLTCASLQVEIASQLRERIRCIVTWVKLPGSPYDRNSIGTMSTYTLVHVCVCVHMCVPQCVCVCGCASYEVCVHEREVVPHAVINARWPVWVCIQQQQQQQRHLTSSSQSPPHPLACSLQDLKGFLSFPVHRRWMLSSTHHMTPGTR